jgi:hypothetical protein
MNLQSLSDKTIANLMKVAKTRGRAFFAHPKAMIELRNEHQRRIENADPDTVEHRIPARGKEAHRQQHHGQP